MRKLSARQYAELLYDLVDGVKKAEVSGRIEKFLKLLVRNRALAGIPRIIQAFETLSDERAGIARVKVTSAHKLPHAIHALLLKSIGAKELAMEACEDLAVIGGVKIEIEDLIIDGTIKTQLTKLKHALIQ